MRSILGHFLQERESGREEREGLVFCVLVSLLLWCVGGGGGGGGGGGAFHIRGTFLPMCVCEL